MDKLIATQKENGNKIQQLVTNYKKDPAARKTLDYYQERLRRLEESWAAFDSLDSEIREHPEVTTSHEYFVKEYHANIKQVVNEYLQLFSTKVNELKAKVLEAPSFRQGMPVNSDSVARNKPGTTTEETVNQFNEVQRKVRRQQEIIRSVRRVIAGLNPDSQTKSYYDVKINAINQYWAQIDEINQTIWELSDHPEQANYDRDEYLSVEEEIQNSLLMLAEQQERVNATLNNIRRSPSNETTTKLPRIIIPKFDGNYLKWRQFYDLFSEMVHKQNMSACQKMWYLKTNLVGEAERLIRHLTISEENYATAWELLKDRYENARLLVNAHLSKLLSQPVIANESAVAIKSLHDTTQECLLGLENLGLSVTNWDPMILHLLIKKLDNTTHRLYEQSLSQPKTLQTLKEFLQFLENRFQSLEALGNKINNRDSQTKQAKGYTLAISALATCAACSGRHPLFACKTFLRMTPTKRCSLVKKQQLCTNCLRPGHLSQNCTLRGCTKCSMKHNTLLHENKPAAHPVERDATPRSSESNQGAPMQPISLTTHSNSKRNYIMLSTALVELMNNKGEPVTCRAILDSGSQVNFITERVMKKLGLTSIQQGCRVQGIGRTIQQAQQRVNILLNAKNSSFKCRLEALVLPHIIAPQPTMDLSIKNWPMPPNIKLADPHFNTSGSIDVLLGAEFYHELLCAGQIKLGEDLPTLHNSALGWIVAGKIGGLHLCEPSCGIGSVMEAFDLEKFWRLEEVDTRVKLLSAEQRFCETQFKHTCKRDPLGRFIVRLPFSQAPEQLGESKDIAIRRFYSLERKLERQPELKAQYQEFMSEYIRLGHMTEIDEKTLRQPYYFMPHHSVIKPESTTTKLRVVFDASSKTSTNVSLNDILATGPTIQDDLFSILLRFRLPRFAFTADVEKMYRQIQVHEEDRRYQLIVWRNSAELPLKIFQLNTVTYGTTTAPYLATKCLQQLATIEAPRYRAASEISLRDFYVDDVMTGANTLSAALENQHQLIEMLQRGGFKLRKWCANHPALMKNIPQQDIALQLDFTDSMEEHIKTLGLTWLPKADVFCVRVNDSDVSLSTITKRTIASDIARLFDPLGIMGPVVVSAKIFLQQLWNLKLDWDSDMPPELRNKWLNFRRGLTKLNDIKFQRHVFGQDCPKIIQLHVFSDASEKAYGGAVYIRSTNSQKCVVVRLLCAKSRVAPIQKTTLPRLELCAAKLASELAARVKQDLKLDDVTTYFWTDSEIVLEWINSDNPASFHSFVANRIAVIQELSHAQQWRHVSSKENPADLLSRGVAPERLEGCLLWFYGPSFLHGQEIVWPGPYHPKREIDLEKKRTATTLVHLNDTIHFLYQIDHRNTFSRLKRVASYMLRFIHQLKKKGKRQEIINDPLLRLTRKKRTNSNLHVMLTLKIRLTPLTCEEIDKGLQVILKQMQEQEFEEDLNTLRHYKELNKTSPLLSLSPFLDEHDIIRVGGRLENSSLPFDATHPILLPYAHPFTKLIMNDIHVKNYHAGPQTVLAITRQKFWPIRGKAIARSIVQHCVTCTRSKPKLLAQIMGNLPSTRVQPARPFINSGVDFWGPIWTHFPIRGKRPQKSYAAVFCCFATKAVHLELVTNLTTDAFIGALRRFIGRRGHCRNLYCDNATNFVGAKHQLQELSETIFGSTATEMIQHRCSEKGIDFHFIPPRAPHFGGLWEAAVKSAKHLLQRSLNTASLTYEELETVLIEIEAILNSRPITSMSTDPNDCTALTPGHFLIGEPLTNPVDTHATPLQISSLKRWKLVTHIKQEFWRRWSREYLNELQRRNKWKESSQNVKRGTIVLIHEDNAPSKKWHIGKIVMQTFKGEDGFVRVANVKTGNKILRRPIHKLAPLPIETEEEAEVISDGGSQGPHIHTNLEDQTRSQNGITDPSETIPDQASEAGRGRHSPRKRMRNSLSTAIVTLLACMSFTLPKGHAMDAVKIETFPAELGVYFENFGTASIASNEWHLVAYYDMKPFWLEFQTLENGTNSMGHLCRQIPQQNLCNKTVTQFELLVQGLKADNQLLKPTTTLNRIKRGAVDAVGNIANALFGVLDSEYAAKMVKIIDNLKDTDEHIIALQINQTSLIDATLNIIKTDQERATRKFQEIDEQFRQINMRLRDTIDTLHQVRLAQLFSVLTRKLILIMENFRRTQTAIIDTIIDTHHGKINPLLLSPRQLNRELTTIKASLPDSLQLATTQDNFLQLYRLMEIEGRVLEGYTIFRIKLPFLSQIRFI